MRRPRVVVPGRVGLFGMEHLSDAVSQPCFAGPAGSGHPGQGVHSVGALVGDEVVDGGAKIVRGGFVGEAEPADRGGQSDLRYLCPVPPQLSDPLGGRWVGVITGGFGGGEGQGSADDRVLFGAEPGAEGGTDRAVGVGGGRQRVGGADAGCGAGSLRRGSRRAVSAVITARAAATDQPAG